jgi:hypothetical protein
LVAQPYQRGENETRSLRGGVHAHCCGVRGIIAGKPIRVRNPDARDELADAFLHSIGADIREGHGEAYYVPSRDFISMPAFAGFKGADHFYNVVFHELTHWSGHKARLDRDLKHRFGSRDYAAEELIAELGAAFLCAEFGFDGDVRNAGYISTWIELLKADKRAFFTACSQAQQCARRDHPRRRTTCAGWPSLSLQKRRPEAPSPTTNLRARKRTCRFVGSLSKEGIHDVQFPTMCTPRTHL